MSNELATLRARLAILEAQHAITLAFVKFLVEALLSQQPEEHRQELRDSLGNIFERTTADLLADDSAAVDTEARLAGVEVLQRLFLGGPGGGGAPLVEKPPRP